MAAGRRQVRHDVEVELMCAVIGGEGRRADREHVLALEIAVRVLELERELLVGRVDRNADRGAPAGREMIAEVAPDECWTAAHVDVHRLVVLSAADRRRARKKRGGKYENPSVSRESELQSGRISTAANSNAQATHETTEMASTAALSAACTRASSQHAVTPRRCPRMLSARRHPPAFPAPRRSNEFALLSGCGDHRSTRFPASNAPAWNLLRRITLRAGRPVQQPRCQYLVDGRR
jgi:hypothetical protein